MVHVESHREEPGPADSRRGQVRRVSAQDNQHPRTSSQYVAFDIRSDFFSLEARREELAQFYMRIFNSVETVPQQWTIEAARNMVDARLDKFGCNIALVDTRAGGKIIAVFFSNIVPGPKGWVLAHPDIAVDPEYRNVGIGAELSYRGRNYANEICYEANGQYLVDNDSKTYKEPAFPREMWKKKGYVLRPLFVQSAKEILGKNDYMTNKLTVDDVKPEEVPELIKFITDPNVVSSDKEQWSEETARAYIQFMLEHHYDTFVVTKVNNQIVALSSADIMPDRTGVSMVEAHTFVKKRDALQEDGIKVPMQNIAAASFFQLFVGANSVSKRLYRQGISEIEIPDQNAAFFDAFLPNLVEDKHFLSMQGDHDTLVANLSPKDGRPELIALVPHSPAAQTLI